MVRNRAWLGAGLILLAAVAAAAQGTEEMYIPEEGRSHPPIVELTGPWVDLLLSLACGAALLPLVASWASLQGGKTAVARRFARAAFLVAGLQAAYGLARVLYPSFFETISGSPSFEGALEEHLRDPDVGWVVLGASVLGTAAAWAMRRAVARRERTPVRVEAGSRIRVPAAPPTASGAGSAPPG